MYLFEVLPSSAPSRRPVLLQPDEGNEQRSADLMPGVKEERMLHGLVILVRILKWFT
jgi:hypothetical protein